MKINFVGKGGSGKSTASALFVKHCAQAFPQDTILACDADINVHLPDELGVSIPEELYLSDARNADVIRKHLIGTNKLIASPDHCKKSTPPSHGSSLVYPSNDNDWFIENFTRKVANVRVCAVGTYQVDGLAKSCYHGKLSVFETLLSHIVDTCGNAVKSDKPKTLVVADTVAGNDAFASTMAFQFDLTVLIVEPTIRSVGVYQNYTSLAANAGDLARPIVVLANKIREPADLDFIKQHIPAKDIIGVLPELSSVRKADRDGTPLASLVKSAQNGFDVQSKDIAKAMTAIRQRLEIEAKNNGVEARQKQLHELHRKIVAQEWVLISVGDISGQCDESFKMPEDEPR